MKEVFDRTTVLDDVSSIIIVFLMMNLFNRFIAMIFVLNFSTSGLNSTALLSLLFVLPGVVFPLIREKTDVLPYYTSSLILLFAGFSVLSVIQNAVLVALFTGITLLLGGLYLLEFTRTKPKRSAYILGIAVTLNITMVLFFTGLTLYVIPARLWYVSAFSLFLVMTRIFKFYNIGGEWDDEYFEGEYHVFHFLTLIYSIIFLALLGSNPFVVSTWSSEISTQLVQSVFTGDDVNLNLIGGLLGITGIFGILIGFYIISTDYLNIEYTIILFILSSIDILLLQVFPLLMYLIQMSTIIGIIGMIEQHSSYSDRVLILGLFLGLILVFLHTVAGHWVFLPSALHGILQGNAGFYLLLIGLSLVITAFITTWRSNDE